MPCQQSVPLPLAIAIKVSHHRLFASCNYLMPNPFCFLSFLIVDLFKLSYFQVYQPHTQTQAFLELLVEHEQSHPLKMNQKMKYSTSSFSFSSYLSSTSSFSSFFRLHYFPPPHLKMPFIVLAFAFS
jgi:hypothetical protein